MPNCAMSNGLVKLVSRAEIEEHDWSLTPGRYVGVAPEEVDEGLSISKRWCGRSISTLRS